MKNNICKNISLILLLLGLTLAVNAQNVFIPDSTFRIFLKTKFPGSITGDSLDIQFGAIKSTKNLTINQVGCRNIDGIQYFDSLTDLVCSGIKLKTIPSLPKGLITFYCDSNEVVSLPELPQALRELSCSHNKLKVLPTLLQKLKILNCSYNLLTSIPSLPSVLVTLDCSYNNIKCLPFLPNNLTNLTRKNTLIKCLQNKPNGLVDALPICSPLQSLICTNTRKWIPDSNALWTSRYGWWDGNVKQSGHWYTIFEMGGSSTDTFINNIRFSRISSGSGINYMGEDSANNIWFYSKDGGKMGNTECYNFKLKNHLYLFLNTHIKDTSNDYIATKYKDYYYKNDTLKSIVLEKFQDSNLVVNTYRRIDSVEFTSMLGYTRINGEYYYHKFGVFGIFPNFYQFESSQYITCFSVQGKVIYPDSCVTEADIDQYDAKKFSYYIDGQELVLNFDPSNYSINQVRLNIYDLWGREMVSTSITESQTRIKLPNLSSQTLIVTIQDTQHDIHNFKVLINDY